MARPESSQISLGDSHSPMLLDRDIKVYIEQLRVAQLKVKWGIEMLENLQQSQWKLRGLLDELEIRTKMLEAINKEQLRLIKDVSEAIDNEFSLLKH
ncbi:hypothetical protein BDV37DRAFT_241958 [Aspergillus pseudonomiae]|uniref:Uncharacterized protein n=1 Tax=Aspergillus pseudonomiae TaxID=1506151 RepID=A0A5N7DLE5_9EURO|nr:uncharacterized protein BDV37DRAFT_241958 [Aspergillus pseudonomiae]KAE8407125.1 hypothetical protein BDV37DRAFT_241958 [Aspergillus pseudonomiae]